MKIFLKQKKKNSDNMVVNDTKNVQKMKDRSLLSIEKNILQNEKKCLIIVYKEVF